MLRETGGGVASLGDGLHEFGDGNGLGVEADLGGAVFARDRPELRGTPGVAARAFLDFFARSFWQCRPWMVMVAFLRSSLGHGRSSWCLGSGFRVVAWWSLSRRVSIRRRSFS